MYPLIYPFQCIHKVIHPNLLLIYPFQYIHSYSFQSIHKVIHPNLSINLSILVYPSVCPLIYPFQSIHSSVHSNLSINLSIPVIYPLSCPFLSTQEMDRSQLISSKYDPDRLDACKIAVLLITQLCSHSDYARGKSPAHGSD